MHLTRVLKKPILSEKTYHLIGQNVFTFLVDPKASKLEIKNAFEKLFEVKVAAVSIIIEKPKAKRVGRYQGKTAKRKKALIKLKKGEKFDMFSEGQNQAPRGKSIAP